jgi:hypothetical protein
MKYKGRTLLLSCWHQSDFLSLIVSGAETDPPCRARDEMTAHRMALLTLSTQVHSSFLSRKAVDSCFPGHYMVILVPITEKGTPINFEAYIATLQRPKSQVQ